MLAQTKMKKSRLCALLAVDYPILQAGLPLVSNPELVAAVSNAGALGVLGRNVGWSEGSDVVKDLRENIHRVRHLTNRAFAVSLFLANNQIERLVKAVIDENVKVVVTYGGSPAIYTGQLKEKGITVLHHVSTVRHARGAESEGADAIIADGNEGGGRRGYDELPSMVLLPQVVDAVNVPVVAQGGVVDGRGFVAALALGAEGVQIESRFIATRECSAHPKVKQAIVTAIDTGTVVVGRSHIPMRFLRAPGSLKLRNSSPDVNGQKEAWWEQPAHERAQCLGIVEGDLDNGLVSCDAGAGMVSDIIGAAEVVRRLISEADRILDQLHGQRIAGPAAAD